MRGTPLPAHLWRLIYRLDATHRHAWHLVMLELELLCPFISYARVLSELRRTRLIFSIGSGAHAPVTALRVIQQTTTHEGRSE